MKKSLKKTIDYLLSEYSDFSKILPTKVFDNYTDFQKYQVLVNIRPPKNLPAEISEDFFIHQDAFLQEYNKNKGIVNLQPINTYAKEQAQAFTSESRKEKFIEFDDSIFLWQGDITKLELDAIVNAANDKMLGCFFPLHKCIDNIIHTHAGVQLRLECDALMQEQGHEEKTGKAKITKAYNLPSKHVIHTVGPIITRQLTSNDRELLASSYRSCLEIAQENNLSSIAFCCISTGEFKFPQDKAAEIAITTVRDFQEKRRVKNKDNMQIVFNVFKDEDYDLYFKYL